MKHTKCTITFDLKYPDKYTLDRTVFSELRNLVNNFLNEVVCYYVYSKNDDSEIYPKNIKIKFEKIK